MTTTIHQKFFCLIEKNNTLCRPSLIALFTILQDIFYFSTSWSFGSGNIIEYIRQWIQQWFFFRSDIKNLMNCCVVIIFIYRTTHSSQFQCLCSMKSSSRTLKSYFIYTKTQSCFFRFSLCATFFPPMNALVYVGHSLGEKSKVARNEKRKKLLWVFVYIKYCKFWRISLELFIKRKLWNWEEWLH